jgi:hypothetical protein
LATTEQRIPWGGVGAYGGETATPVPVSRDTTGVADPEWLTVGEAVATVVTSPDRETASRVAPGEPDSAAAALEAVIPAPIIAAQTATRTSAEEGRMPPS